MSTITSPSGSSQRDAGETDQNLMASAASAEADEPEAERMRAKGMVNEPSDSASLRSATVRPPDSHRRQPVRWIGAGIVIYLVLAGFMQVGNPLQGILLLPASSMILALVVHDPGLQGYAYPALCATLPLNAFLWGLLLYGTVVLVDGVKGRVRRG